MSHGIYTSFSQAERSALEEDLEDLEKKMAALAFPKQKAQEWQKSEALEISWGLKTTLFVFGSKLH